MERELRKGLSDGSVQVYYQPKVNTMLRQVVGMEALVRWAADEGMVSPSEFIPLAEESDLIDDRNFLV